MIDLNKITIYNNMSHDELVNQAKSCRRCPLHEGRTQVVFYSGNPNADLMLIGEGPGQQEDEQGVPFVGRSGQLLTKILESVDIFRDDIYIANTVKCRPPSNRTPTASEMTACQDYLIRQIQLVQPKVIGLLGSAAVKAVGGPESPISTIRGSWLNAAVNYMAEDVYIMPMFHPSYLLRNPSKEKGAPKWLMWNDIKEIKAALSFYATIKQL
jgi:uracil-DNA glycosylase family 4